jgi:hypothetical protein
MKKIFLSLAIFMAGYATAQNPSFPTINNVQVPFEQQMNTVFQNLNLSSVSTHVLNERSVHLSDPSKYNGLTVDSASISDFDRWALLYITMYSGCWQQQFRLPDPQTAYMNPSQTVTEAGVIPFVMLHYNYHSMLASSVTDNLISVTNGQLYDVPNRSQSPYVLNTCFAATPMVNTINRGQVNFVFQNNFFFTNTGKTVAQLQVNMDDGLGYRTVSWNQNIAANYTTSGAKEILTKIIYTDGTQVENNSKLQVNLASTNNTGRYANPFMQLFFSGTRPYNGGTSNALVTVGLGCGNTQITKPLIYIEGFDPPRPGEVQPTGGYGKLRYDVLGLILGAPRNDLNNNQVILKQYLEEEGYDLIYIDFESSVTYIERNAYLVEEIIEWVNQQKAAAGSVEKNVVFCQSMGGLIGRYALRDMELQNIDHQAARYIAFDSPHQGANIPLGYQCMISNLAATEILGHSLDLMFPALQSAMAILNSPAAKEMLIYHANATSFAGDMPERQNLMNWFSVNGLPQNCESIAIASGSETGQGHIFNPGDIIMHSEGFKMIFPWAFWPRTFDLGAHCEFTVRAVPDMGMSQIYAGHIQIFVFFVPVLFYDSNTNVNNETLPYDSCPAGIFDFEDFEDDLFGQLPGDVTYYPQFSFVPVMSSLDVVAPYNQNIYTPINSLSILQNARTPFDNYYSSFTTNLETNTTNEKHTFFTIGNIGYFRDLFAPPHTLPSVAGFPNLVGVNYNYGKNTNQATTSRITESYVIGPGSTIRVNGNTALGLPTDNLNPPTQASDFVVSVGNYGCGNDPVIEVQNGGQIIVGDNSTLNKGALRIMRGTHLIVRTGGKLIVHDNSRIVIEEGATLTYESGAQIQLLGANAVLDIRGFLTLGNNANFTFTYPNATSGFVRFSRPGIIPSDINDPNYQIHHGTNCKISLEGVNRNDKMLEIAQDALWIPDALTGFSIRKSKVDYVGKSKISVSCPNIELFDSRFVGLTQQEAYGFYLYGQPLQNITACRFENLRVGIESFNSYGGAPLRVELLHTIKA